MDKLTFNALKTYNVDSGGESDSVYLGKSKTESDTAQESTQDTKAVEEEVKPVEQLDSVIAYFKANPDKTNELLSSLISLANKSEETKSD